MAVEGEPNVAQSTHPVEWALLVQEASEAHEHLDALIEQLARAGEIGDEDLRVQLGHVYAHLNRFWRTRNLVGERAPAMLQEYSAFPDDVPPVG